MIGKKLKSFQVDDDDTCASRGSIKRREEIQWRKDFDGEVSPWTRIHSLEGILDADWEYETGPAQYDPEEWNDCE